jgi:branched-subunit amino acid aminotransferase/4-amino-4-deoxychorismate lyase
MYANLDGTRLPQELALLPWDDFSAAAATTARIYGAAPYRFDRHLAALADTLAAPEFAFHRPLAAEAITNNLAQLIADNHLYDATTTVIATVGKNPHTLITLAAIPPIVAERQTSGVVLIATPARRLRSDRLARYKLLGQSIEFAAVGGARGAGADYGIIADEAENYLLVAGAHFGTIFAVGDGALITPSVERDNVIAGITRGAVIELAARLGIVVYEEPLTPSVIERAAEIFITASAIEITPARRLNAREYRDFPLTRRLQTAWREKVAEELAREI